MQHVDGDAGNFEHVGGWDLFRPGAFVDVATDGGDRSDGFELGQDFRVADVPGMDDVVGALQGCERLRPQ